MQIVHTGNESGESVIEWPVDLPPLARRLHYDSVFPNWDEKYAHYIKASQAGIVRLDVNTTDPTIRGLTTDGASSCLTIIITNSDKTRLSLTHTDLAFDEQAIIDECHWIGDPCKITIIKGSAHINPLVTQESQLFTKTIPRLKAAIAKQKNKIDLDLESFPFPSWAAAISREGKIEIFTSDLVRIGIAAPLISYRHPLNMLNLYALQLQPKYHPLDIQYDGKQWTKMPVLSPDALKLIESVQKNACRYKHVIDEDRFLKESHQYLVDLATLSNEKAVELHGQKKYSEAIKQFRNALIICKIVNGENHLDVSKNYKSIGVCYFYLKDYPRAQEYLLKAKSIAEKNKSLPEDYLKKIDAKLEEIQKNLDKRHENSHVEYEDTGLQP